MPLLRALLFQFSLCAPLAVAGELKFDQTNDTAPPVPAGASLTLSLPEKAMIGEMVPGKLIVRNTGSEAFEISTGGDYRGSPVPHRLKVRVTHASGKVLQI